MDNPDQIKVVVVAFYQKLLGTSSVRFNSEMASRVQGLSQKKLDNDCIRNMQKPVTEAEIKESLFAMKSNKAPGPDGFSVRFYKVAWLVIGEDVICAIKSFFTSGKLLREVNSTIINLVPKVPNPAAMDDFRPISCCNVLYKCITKILAKRYVKGLDGVIGPQQFAFIPGRSIAENVMLAQEVVKNYHREGGSPRCAMKVDLMKAHDSVDCNFMFHCLLIVGAPEQFVDWIKECITTPKFSIALNGTLVVHFEGRTGLRQGDSISSYLFVLAMEAFSQLLEEISTDRDFHFHQGYSSLKLTHLVFADDLLLFSMTKLQAVQCVKKVLAEFASLAGLNFNPSKSTFFCSGVSKEMKVQIGECLQMREGSLPVR